MKKFLAVLSALAAFCAPAFAADAPQQSAFGGFVPLIVIFVIFYFLLIRPQQKKAKEHTTMLNALKKDDKVITGGGIFGTVTAVKGDVIEVKIAENVKVEVSKQAISAVITKEVPKAEEIKTPEIIK
jgi:preprotein translocase subunit YajC